MLRVPHFGFLRREPTHRRAKGAPAQPESAPSAPQPSSGKAAPTVVVRRGTMQLRGRVSDLTEVFPAVSDVTEVLAAVPGADPQAGTVERPLAAALPPSQHRHDSPAELWRPKVGGDPRPVAPEPQAAVPGPRRARVGDDWSDIPVTTVRRDRQERRVFTEVPTEAPSLPETSHHSLAAYNGPDRGVIHNAAVNASWFRSGVCDQTKFDALMERFAVTRGVLVGHGTQARPAGSPDTQIFTVVGHPLFIDDSTGRQNS